MMTKLGPKNRLHLSLITSFLLAGMGFSHISNADTCPPIASIFSSDPTSDNFVTYLAPGWRSPLSPIHDLQRLRFTEVYGDAVGMKCVYDTSDGYITMYPNNNEKIDTYALMGNNKWRCEEQELGGFNPGVQLACTCNESLDVCSFNIARIAR